MTSATVGNGGVTVNLVIRKIAEGRLSKIDIDLGLASGIDLMRLEDPTSPVVVRFDGSTKSDITGKTRYLNIYDHRKRAIEMFRQEGLNIYITSFDVVTIPCLIACRMKSGFYLVLADIGTPDIADGEEVGWVLSTWPYDREKFRVVANEKYQSAIHAPTGICVIQPYTPRPKEE